MENEKKPDVYKHRAKRRIAMEKESISNWIIFRVAICTPRSENVNYPTQHSSRANPRKNLLRVAKLYL